MKSPVFAKYQEQLSQRHNVTTQKNGGWLLIQLNQKCCHPADVDSPVMYSGHKEV
jgi:hypothetical protein